MPASVRRRERRLLLGAYKKFSSHSVEKGHTVGVCVVQVYQACTTSRKVQPCTTSVAAKASEGAEKSCRTGRRRKRGLRKGKRRSRGLQPPQAFPGPATSSVSNRALTLHLRWCSSKSKTARSFRERLRRASSRWANPGLSSTSVLYMLPGQPVPGYYQLFDEYLALRSKVREGDRVLADALYEHSWEAYLETVTGFRLALPGRSGRPVATVGAASALFELAQRVRPARNSSPSLTRQRRSSSTRFRSLF